MASEVDADTARRVRVRPGDEHDLPGIAAIYTHYVLNTTITFHTQVRTPVEWRDRFRTHVVDGPYDLLVATGARDEVVGYVETLPFRPKPAYARSIELSIYVAPDAVGRGVGSALLARLLERLAATEFHRLFAIVTLPNPSSVAFHERHGFVHRGTLTEAGHKFDRYLDVAYYELALPRSDELALPRSDELALPRSDELASPTAASALD